VSTLLARGVRLVAAGGFSSAAIDEVKQVTSALQHTATHATHCQTLQHTAALAVLLSMRSVR